MGGTLIIFRTQFLRTRETHVTNSESENNQQKRIRPACARRCLPCPAACTCAAAPTICVSLPQRARAIATTFPGTRLVAAKVLYASPRVNDEAIEPCTKPLQHCNTLVAFKSSPPPTAPL
ncbi:hypothetical protein NL676_024975 [Syzygium grande]|nr:hypothetical protein NL676_024975 [Syzygium grande]